MQCVHATLIITDLVKMYHRRCFQLGRSIAGRCYNLRYSNVQAVKRRCHSNTTIPKLELKDQYNVHQISQTLISLNDDQLSNVADEYKNNNTQILEDNYFIGLCETFIGGAWILNEKIDSKKLESKIQKSLIKYPWLASQFQSYNYKTQQ